MGKIADALEKAGNIDELSINHDPEIPEPESPAVEVLQSQSASEVQSPNPAIEFERTKPAVSSRPRNSKLAAQPNVSGKWDQRLFRAVNNDAVIPEVFKTIRSKILHPRDGRTVPRTILVASSLPQEGKSFISANLGISFANGMDQHCLLVDCDLRHPKLAIMFGIENNYGLVDYLRNQINLTGVITKTSVEKLSIIPSGRSPVNPAELLSSGKMQHLIEEVSGRYDNRIVIFDSPPMLMAAESLVLAGHVDSIIMVVRRGRAKKGEVQKFIDTVGEEKILGIVFNDHIPNSFDQSVTQGYGY